MIFSQFEWMALALTLGGTVLIGVWGFRTQEIKVLIKMTLGILSRRGGDDAPGIVQEILKLAEAYKNHSLHLEEHLAKCPYPFLRESVEMAREGMLEENNLLQILQARIHSNFLQQIQIVRKLKLIAPYPASLGIVGAVIAGYAIIHGLINGTQVSELRTAFGFGSACLASGTALTYMVIQPLCRALDERAQQSRMNHILIAVGTKLMVQKSNPIIVAEELNSYLLEGERLAWSSVVGRKVGDAA